MKYNIEFNSTTKKGKVSKKTQTYIAKTEDQARLIFKEEADKMSKFRGIKREIINVNKVGSHPTYDQSEDLKNRTGIRASYGDYEATGWMDK